MLVPSFVAIAQHPPLLVVVLYPSDSINNSLSFDRKFTSGSTLVFFLNVWINDHFHNGFDWMKIIKEFGLLLTYLSS